MNIYPRCLAFVQNLLLMALALSCAVSSAQSGTPPPSRDTVKQTMLRQPLHFEAAADGSMSSRGMGRKLRVNDGGAVTFGEQGRNAISMLLDGANPQATPIGQNLLTGRSNYLLGKDQAKWRTGVSQFGRVQVSAVYPGVDLVYYGNGDQLEHDYLLASNADPGLIRMQFLGASARLDAKTGALVLRQPESSEEVILLEQPVAYQLAENGTRQSVAASYRLRADGEAQFALGSYDHTRPLVIDPVILYGTYFGGNQYDSIVDLKLGSDGSIFLLMTGDSTDLKTVGAPSGICDGACGPMNPDQGDVKPDMYVAKLDSTGQKLLFATYLGGSDDDEALSLALDSDGSVYIAGFSHSQDFPVVNGYPGGTPAIRGNPAGTLSKLSADGSTLLYSTLIGFGQPAIDFISQIGNATAPIMATANNGIVYLIGIATSNGTGTDFAWKTNALFATGNDFLAKFDTTRSGTASIVYATQIGDSIGGLYSAQLTSLALDSKGDVWLYGQTSDPAFPTTTSGALQPQCMSNPCSASFLMEIDPTGISSPYATYLGGSTAGGTVTARDIVIDPSDNIYVSGATSQSDFPIVNGAITSLGSGIGYASKLSPDGKTLLYSSFVPGIEIAASSNGQLAFTGTYGPGLTLRNNLQTTPPPSTGTDAIFGLIDTTESGANSLLVSSYLGASNSFTQANRVLIASTGQILVAGETTATNLPVVNAYQSTCASCATRTGGDGFIAAIQPNNTLTLTPATLVFPSTNVNSTSAAMTGTLYNGTTKSIYLTQPTLTDSTDFHQSNNCNGIMSPLASCTVTITFTPQSSGMLSSIYAIADLNNQSAPLTIALSGTGNPAAAPGSDTLAPATVDFGVVSLGSVATQTVTFTNSSNAPITVYNYSNSNSAFSVIASTCVVTVPANSSCTYTLQFSPTGQGLQTGTFQVGDRISNPSVSVTGTATTYIVSPQITLTPNPLVFKDVPQGQTPGLLVTLTNGSTFPITFPVDAPSIDGSTNTFSISGTAGAAYCPVDNGITPMTTLAPGATCSYYVYFASGNTNVGTSVSATITWPYSPPGTTFKYAATGTVTANTISGPVAEISPTTLQFPATASGKTSAAQVVTVTNTGAGTLGFVSATVSGTNPANFAQTNNCTASIGSNGSCQISITFSPDASTNEFTAVLDVKTSTGDTNVTLNGGTASADFILSTPSLLEAGQNPSWVISVAPLSASVGFDQPITFTVTGLGNHGIPSFSPTTVTPNGNTVMTTLSLANVTAGLRPKPGPYAQLPILACFLVFFSFRKRMKRGRAWIIGMALVFALATQGLTGCTNGVPNIFPFTVTATSGSISHTLQLSLQY